jgi:small-conductance mechanosensitive channel
MEFSERVNIEILQRFNDAGIEFAFPTQTIHMTKKEASKS